MADWMKGKGGQDGRVRAASAKGAKGRRRTPGFMMSEIIDVPFPRAESSCLTSLRIFQLQDEHKAGAQRGGQFPCAAVCSSEQSKHTTRKEPATHIWSVDENDRNRRDNRVSVQYYIILLLDRDT
jgi:hypothetical protein